MSTEWANPDGLEPPGEQLELPWDGETLSWGVPEVVETIVHRVKYWPTGWSCACGAGRTWPRLTPPGRARGAALAHMTGVRRRITERD